MKPSPDLAAKIVKASALVREAPLVSGVPELDRLLGPSGLARGSLVDLHAGEGARALELALAVAARLAPAPRALVLVDSQGDFYPPAAAQAGVDLERLIVVRTAWVRTAWGRTAGRARGGRAQERDALAAVDEALRSRAVAAVVARLQGLDAAASHRLRVAAEAGGSLGFLVRPLEERTQVSGAAVRLLVEPRSAEPRGRGALRLAPLRVRGGQP